MLELRRHQVSSKLLTHTHVYYHFSAELLAVGSFSPEHKHTEMYQPTSGNWSTVQDYPFLPNVGKYVAKYAVLYYDDAFYLFGGHTAYFTPYSIHSYSNLFTQTIAQLDTKTKIWSKIGILRQGRQGHGAIYYDGKFFVFGGRKNPKSKNDAQVKNEVCTLKGSKMTCIEQSTGLDKYRYYPELFLVAENFVKDNNDC